VRAGLFGYVIPFRFATRRNQSFVYLLMEAPALKHITVPKALSATRSSPLLPGCAARRFAATESSTTR
jgi:hypothetical protein